MDTNFLDYQPKYSDFHQYFYLHRVKATLHISQTTPLNEIANKLVNLVGSGFIISQSNKIYTDFKDGGIRYSPLEVRVIDSKKEKRQKNEKKHWAYLDHVKNIIHIDSKQPEKRVEQFIAFLNDNGIQIVIDHTDYSYVEICCRHPYNTYRQVTETLDKLAKRFDVGKTDLKIDKLASGEEHSHLIRNLYIDCYCNIKTYKRVNDFKTAEQCIDREIEPKLEIQIYKPKSLEEANQRGISVLKAIVSFLNITTLAMDRKFEIADYTHIPESSKIGQNRKVSSCLNSEELKTLPNLPDFIINHKHSRNLVSAVWFEAKRANQICNWLNVSDSTFRRTLRRLGNIIERRGDRKTGYFYGIDTTQINNTSQGSYSNISNNRKKNKGKALDIALLLIIGANILFSYYFSSFYLKTPKTSKDIVSLKSEDYIHFLIANQNISDTALMIDNNFSLINKSIKDLERPDSLLIISELKKKGGESQ